MKFVYPEFLWALFAIAVPIIIHLFNFRKFKKVNFSNVKFLKEVKQETQSKSNLKHLLVLLMRILAVTAMVLAFCLPYIPGDGTQRAGAKAVSVYIDNSFSMDGINTNGRLFELAQNRIVTLVQDNYEPTDRFQLVTNDFEGKHQRFVNRESFLRMLDETKISPSARNLSEVMGRQQDAFAEENATTQLSFWFSDFQKSTSDFESLPSDTSMQVYLQPIPPEESKNVYIDSIWFGTPVRQMNQQEELFLRVVNTSDDEYATIPVRLEVNGQQKAVGSFSMAGQSSIDTVLYFTNTESGYQQAKVSIQDYPITFDDDFYFAYEVAAQIPVLAIEPDGTDNSGQYFGSIFQNDPFYQFSIVNERAIDYGTLSDYNFIVLSELPNISSGLAQELSRFIDNGGSVMVFPAGDMNKASYNTFLESVRSNRFVSLESTPAKVAKINLEHALYHQVFDFVPKNIDLPMAQKHYKLERPLQSSAEDVLRLQNGDVFLSSNTFGKGKVYVSAVPLNNSFSNFTRHAVFVTTLLRAAELSVPSNPLYYTIGRDEGAELTNFRATGEQTFRLSNTASGYEVIPEHRNFGGKTTILFRNQIQEAGNYDLSFDGESKGTLGFNYPRKESDPEAYGIDELEALLPDLGLDNFSLIAADGNSNSFATDVLREKHYWKYCIMAVLFFLALEVLLLKLWKN